MTPKNCLKNPNATILMPIYQLRPSASYRLQVPIYLHVSIRVLRHFFGRHITKQPDQSAYFRRSVKAIYVNNELSLSHVDPGDHLLSISGLIRVNDPPGPIQSHRLAVTG
ncbi:hypothetical protein [Pseudomonas syringae group genomosp. 3]|uniref:hypothetical protein n=1 Tax=Pseudomonas syringae group genomosp. 3 TaxID=251701 RepID=UPI0020007AD0|nr:hypothetical protein [Pseudomonas syringae group genomosp. 3]